MMPKILLVEDNEMNRDMLSRRLERKGHQVIIAVDGEQGVAIAQSQTPDIILMDMSLPVMDGWEATRKLRSIPKTSKIPIIALTAHAMRGDREKCLAAGCDDYDTKPVEFPQLLGKIQVLLERQQPVTALNKEEEVKPVAKPESSRVLIVDDLEANRDLLARRLKKQGFAIEEAENGRKALEVMQASNFDLVLLDIMMPEMNGYQVLEHLKADPKLRHIPVIMISAMDEIEGIVKCIELGAEDYLLKPFNAVLLKARIKNCLEKKRLRDTEQDYLKQLQAEKAKSERLLLSILPEAIAEKLKHNQDIIADSFPEATVLFADIVGFTELSANRSPIEVVGLLNKIFSAFDTLAHQHGLEKIKTIGDAYMVAGGLPIPRSDHAEAMAEMALDMLNEIIQFNTETGVELAIRIGINTGPVVAGVIGTHKFIYDLWGDTVNIASRMESHGLAGCIQVTATTYELLQDQYIFQQRGAIEVKGKGEMTTYMLSARKNEKPGFFQKPGFGITQIGLPVLGFGKITY